MDTDKLEKVIKGLECCLTKPEHNCEECPYEGDGEGGWPCKSPQMKADALELLKEKEPVYATWQQGKMFCGACGAKFPSRTMMRFCHRCGREIRLKVNDG